jgi:hypothetical protein
MGNVIWALAKVAAKLADAYAARESAATDSERIAADVLVRQLEARQAVLVAGGRWIAPVQAAFAAMFLIYNAKLIIWDKVLGLGTTDPLSPELYWLQGIVVGFIFLQAGVDKLRRVV